MKRDLDPSNPEVHAAIIKRIKSMTPKEKLEFLLYREPGVEETDMTGYGNISVPNLITVGKR